MILIRKSVYILIVVISCHCEIWSQEFIHLDGLSVEYTHLNQNAILLYQDSMGFLWVGTNNGVLLYDGYEFQHYGFDFEDSIGFIGGVIHTIHEDSQGSIWIGTDKGLNKYDRSKERFDNIPHIRSTVDGIISIKDEKIFSSPGSIQILKSNGTVKKELETENGLNFFQNDTATFAYGNGFYQVSFQNGALAMNQIIADIEIVDVCEGLDKIILATHDKLYFIDRTRNKKEINIPISISAVSSILFDRYQNLWVGTLDLQLHKININEAGSSYPITSFEIDIYPLDLIQDRSGNIFIAGHNIDDNLVQKKLNKYVPRSGIFRIPYNFNQYTYTRFPEPYMEAYAWNFVQSENGDIWVGTHQGLFHYHADGTYNIYRDNTAPNAISSNEIFCLIKDQNGVWIGTKAGLDRYESSSGRIEHVYKDWIDKGVADNQGQLWFSASSVLHKVDRKFSVTKYDSINGRPLFVNRHAYDGSNTIWVKSFNDWSLYKFEIGDADFVLKKVYLTEGEINHGINFMLDDGIGKIWMSSDRGVYIFSKSEERVIKFLNDYNSKLANDGVYELVLGNNQDIWLNQNNGSSVRMDIRTFELLPFSLDDIKPNNVQKKSASVIAAGLGDNFFMDSFGGFVQFNLRAMELNTISPLIHLTGIMVNGVEAGSKHEFKYSGNNFDFNFVGLQFDDPSQNQYAVFLEGADKGWQNLGIDRTARYLNLSPGEYSFHIKSSNSDKVWSQGKMVYTFEIMPPWYKSLTAYFVYFISMLTIVIVVYRIVLNRKLALAESRQLREMDEFKNDFFTNITHEFRTPLTVISGLANKVDDKSGRLIAKNAERLLSLINQILELTKIEVKQTSINLQYHNVSKSVKILLESFASLADDKNVALKKNIEDSIYSITDLDKFELIVQNLVSNAIKFTPSGGMVEIKLELKDDLILFIVNDSGPGISEQDLPYIFDKFYQGNIKSDQVGSGIGLSLTRKLTEVLSGNLSVESNQKEGTTFMIKIPLIENHDEIVVEDHSSIIVQQGSLPNEEPLQILIVEDNEDILELLVDMLHLQYEIQTASNGREGLAKAREHLPDLIISDVMMPLMSGLEMLNILKDDETICHIPTILLTAKVDQKSRMEGLTTGANVYINKPFNKEELLMTVRNLINLKNEWRKKYAAAIEDDSVVLPQRDSLITKIHDLVYEHIANEEFGVQEICLEFGISRTQVHRKLKSVTGKSVTHFIRDIKMKEARKLLRRSDYNVSEIAYSLGFSDPNYFSRIYAEKFNVSPSKDRNGQR